MGDLYFFLKKTGYFPFRPCNVTNEKSTNVSNIYLAKYHMILLYAKISYDIIICQNNI